MIENARAAPTTEGQMHPEIEFGIPLNAEKRPLRGMDGHNFKCVGDVCLRKPSAHPCQLNQFDSIIDGSIVQRKGDKRNETIDAGDGTVVRPGQIENQAGFFRIFPSSHANWTNAEQGKWKITERPDYVARIDLRHQQWCRGRKLRKEDFFATSNGRRREHARPKNLGKAQREGDPQTDSG